ncbi:hypothetical protein [Paenibacillus xylaniclasticus]|uniref:hypothetical protein n=1 Tax=Paenibacillus xylaniclasticus TaxID=588083 RepID=UPI000FDAEC52|nr:MULTISPECIES: hypothetical protein [Paenibacillus]GFN32033.1 hypothetical protein PCURB6_22930 [Paenibacillus curdlanolyticus]
MYANQQGSQFQTNVHQPFQSSGGYVQSHYQGQLSQPSFGQGGIIPSPHPFASQASHTYSTTPSGYQNITPTSPSLGPVISRYGYQAGPDLHQPLHSYTPVNSPIHSSSSISQSYPNQPVISRYGYQAGPDTRSPVNAVFQQQGYNAFQHQPLHTTSYGSQTSQHPVYQATHAYEQAGPVIQHYGGYESNYR